MGRRKKGGVLTQKVIVSIGLVMLLVTGAVVCCADATDAETTEIFTIKPETDFSWKGERIGYELIGNTSAYYEAELTDSSGVKHSNALTDPNGNLTGNTEYNGKLTVTVPDKAGNYILNVKFYPDSEKSMVIYEKSVPLKVVDPIKLSFTLYNSSDSSVTFQAYFKVNGQVIPDSTKDVKIEANKSESVTYDYYVRDVSDTTYSLECDSEIIRSAVLGLGVERTFYASENDYTLVTGVTVGALILLAIALAVLLRRPVVNTGKPKGRR